MHRYLIEVIRDKGIEKHYSYSRLDLHEYFQSLKKEFRSIGVNEFSVNPSKLHYTDIQKKILERKGIRNFKIIFS
jgi:hypothetical protein